MQSNCVPNMSFMMSKAIRTAWTIWQKCLPAEVSWSRWRRNYPVRFGVCTTAEQARTPKYGRLILAWEDRWGVSLNKSNISNVFNLFLTYNSIKDRILNQFNILNFSIWIITANQYVLWVICIFESRNLIYMQENFLLILIHNTCITHVNTRNKESQSKC